MDHILNEYQEQILFAPILAYKIKPNENMLFGFIKANWRFLLFTNRKLYTMDPEVFNKGLTDRKSKLIINNIDILEQLSHIIFFPKFEFNSYEILNHHKITPQFQREFEQKKIDIIIGFKGINGFKESDIAVEGDMMMLIKLIHACQLAKIYDKQEKVKKERLDKEREGARRPSSYDEV